MDKDSPEYSKFIKICGHLPGTSCQCNGKYYWGYVLQNKKMVIKPYYKREELLRAISISDIALVIVPFIAKNIEEAQEKAKIFRVKGFKIGEY